MDLLARLRALPAALTDGRSGLSGGLHPRRLIRRVVGAPVHVCNLTLDLEVGGVANRIATVCNGLDTRRYMTSCLCLERRGALAERFEPRVPIWSLHRPDPLATATIWRVAQLLRRYRVDVLQTHGSATHLCGVVAARLARVPLVVHTDHGLAEGEITSEPIPPRLYAGLTDGLVAVSRAAAGRLASRCGVPPATVQVLPTAVSLDRFRPPYDALQPRLTLGIDPDQFVIGTVGRLAPGRGHRELLEAAAQLRRQGLDFRLLIVGEGPTVETLRTRARELGIHDVLLLAGFTKEVPAMLAAMDCFISTRVTDGIPTAVLEAMACGRAVVAVNEGGVTEVLHDGETGLLVPRGQPGILARIVGQLAESDRRRSALGDRARAYVTEHHSVGEVVKAYSALFRSLLRGVGANFDNSTEN